MKDSERLSPGASSPLVPFVTFTSGDCATTKTGNARVTSLVVPFIV